MGDSPLTQAATSSTSGWLVFAGVAFMVVWLIGSVVWIMMSGMASLMANDSGSASNDKHMTLIVTMLIGQALTLLAGAPGGLAFFWCAHRWHCLMAFTAMFLVGAGIQVWALMSFFGKGA